MEMVLRSMRIENFKGIRRLSVQFGDQETRIYGGNATGKTTIFDAFLWLLFDKDSTGRSAFEVKPLDKGGQEVHNLDTLVEASFAVDGQPVVLTRKQVEEWAKPRGAVQQVFKGNVSSYWINAVPVKAGEYREYIAGMTSEELFKLVTNPAAFNALDWKKRRSTLVSLSGADVDGMLLAREEYAPLRDDMAARNIRDLDKLRKVYADQRRAYNDELKVLPARIDEVQRMAGEDISDSEYIDAEGYLKDAEETLNGIARQIAQAETEDPRKALSDRLRSALSVQDARARVIASEHAAKRREAERDYRRAREDADHIMRRLRQDQEAASRHRKALEGYAATRDRLRADYRTRYDVPYEPGEIEEVCLTCGQSLPEEMIEKARENHREEWRRRKESGLEEIRAAGHSVNADIQRTEALLAEADSGIAQSEEEHRIALQAAEALEDAYGAIPEQPDLNADGEYITARDEAERIQAELDGTEDDGRIGRLKDRKADIEKRAAGYRAKLAKREAAQRARDRAAELEEGQARTGATLADVENRIMLAEAFAAARCRALEEGINNLFPTVRWKLFDEQINGGLVDTCACMIGGVPYTDANNAARINAGLEIINVLCAHYGVSAPVFIDNAESVNAIADTVGQKICLIVSYDDALRIESERMAA